MSRLASLVGIALIAGALAACADAVTVRPTYVGSYHPSMLTYQARQGAMKTEIFGNLFSAPKATLDNAVTGAMSGSIFGRPVQFATAVPPENRSPYRVVMVVNPAKSMASDELCQTSDYPTGGPASTLRMEAAFCANGQALTATGGTVAGVQSADDPKFRTLVRQIALALFPVEDPNRDNGDRDIDFPAD